MIKVPQCRELGLQKFDSNRVHHINNMARFALICSLYSIAMSFILVPRLSGPSTTALSRASGDSENDVQVTDPAEIPQATTTLPLLPPPDPWASVRARDVQDLYDARSRT